CQISCDQALKFNRKSYLVYHGIDLERFRPKLTLGFIGKINNNGRKGEDLFEILRNLPFVELKITNGTVPEEQMPHFYHAIDYVFIPSVVEGGPLCFQEGLVSGKEIISSDVGMVHDFKGFEGVHIFDRSNPQSLIGILENLFQKKMNLRRHIEAYSRQYFVQKHLEIFKLFAGN
ncbi:MAG TPA: glycosyltransferase, partial [Chitinispirillaceae bacterium]|nr:glycosyltransferase [Chitinispirillaceae bacterium]